MRHLPRHYSSNSTYALFPFFTPDVTKKNLTNLAKKGIVPSVDLYDFSRPKAIAPAKVVDTLTGIHHVFNSPEKFKTLYLRDFKMMLSGYGCFLAFDERSQ